MTVLLNWRMHLQQFALWIIVFNVTACAGTGENGKMTKLDAQVILSSAHCGSDNPQASLSVYSSIEQLAQDNSQLADQMDKRLEQNAKIDFSKSMLVQINMGLKRTGGYSIVFNNAFLSDDNWVNLSVQWNLPQKGMMQTQALTKPCLLLTIPVVDSEGIRVLDKSGKLRVQHYL